MWVHGEPGKYVVVTLGAPVRKDFIDGASWRLLECWGKMPELACVDATFWGWLLELVGAVFGGRQGSGQASSIVVQCVDRQPG